MGAQDSRIDAYIEKRPVFARPILEHIRAAVHRSSPEIEEALKWSSPSFLYKGKILCGMAAFKEHATFGFWHGDLVTGQKGLGAMGSFGRLTRVEDLPDDAALAAMLAKGMALIDEGVKPPHVEGRGKHVKPELEMVPTFQAALDAEPKAKTAYESFAPSARRDYLEWIVDAKRDETRDKRVAQAIEWLAEGKKRHWKYENC